MKGSEKSLKKKSVDTAFPELISKELPPHLAQEIPLHTLGSLLCKESVDSFHRGHDNKYYISSFE